MARLEPGKYEPKGTLEERLPKITIAKSNLRNTYQIIHDKYLQKHREAERIIYQLRAQRVYDN